jgi:hypothetical protein
VQIVPIAAEKKTPDPPAAPIPVQLLSAQKVFISNGESAAEEEFDLPNLTYDEFYASLKSWGKFELAPTPADADLIFKISFAVALSPQLRLVVLDPKTHVVLWTFTEKMQSWSREATGRKNFDQAMAKLVGDLKDLTTPPPAPTPK